MEISEIIFCEKKLCVIFACNHYDIPTLRSIFADGRGR